MFPKFLCSQRRHQQKNCLIILKYLQFRLGLLWSHLVQKVSALWQKSYFTKLAEETCLREKTIRQTIARNSAGTLSWKHRGIPGQLCDIQKERPQKAASLLHGPDSVDRCWQCLLSLSPWKSVGFSSKPLTVRSLYWTGTTGWGQKQGQDKKDYSRNVVLCGCCLPDRRKACHLFMQYLSIGSERLTTDGWMDRKIACGWLDGENELHFLPTCILRYLFCIRTKAMGYAM